MAVFNEREKALENKYFRDTDLKFKAVARRNRLFGQWVAAQLGLTGKDADAYAVEVVKSDFQEAGDDDILRKVTADLKAKGKPAVEAELTAKLGACQAEAISQLEAEQKK